MRIILDGFRQVSDFSGRDRRGRFWPYALVVAVLIYAGTALAMIPAMSGMFEEATRYAAENPDATTVVAGPGHYSVRIDGPDAMQTPDLGPFFWVMRGVVVAIAILLAAAVTRRLHDTGRAGWWGLPPLVLLAGGVMLFPGVMNSMMQSEDAPMGLFFLLFANNVLYMLSLIALIALIVLLALKGSVGPNRYGAEPD